MIDLLDEFEKERIVRGVEYKVTVDDVRSFLERFVYNNSATVRIEGAVVSAVWSYEISGHDTNGLSLGLADQSGGKIRVIGRTAAGLFIAALQDDAYDGRRAFNKEALDAAADGSDDFWSRLSRFFVENTDHPLITITPNGAAFSVYGVTEINTIAANAKINVINGTERRELGFNLFSSGSAAQRAYLVARFNGEFAGDLMNSNYTQIYRLGEGDAARYYFEFDEITKEALGLAGVTLESHPAAASLVVTQQEIRSDLLIGAHVRGLDVALFGLIMKDDPAKFLEFIGNDYLGTPVGVVTGISDDFKALDAALKAIIEGLWQQNPTSDILTLLKIFAEASVANEADRTKLTAYFAKLAAAAKAFIENTPETLKRDLANSYDQIERGAAGYSEQTIVRELLDRLTITAGARAIYILDQWRDEQKSGRLHSPAQTIVGAATRGAGFYSESETELGHAWYVNLGTSLVYGAIRDIFETISDVGEYAAGAVLKVILGQIDGAAETIDTIISQFGKIGEFARDEIGKIFRNQLFASVSFANGKTATEAFDSSLGIGNVFQLQIGTEQATLFGNANNNWQVHFGNGNLFGFGGDDKLVQLVFDPLPDGTAHLLDGGTGDDWVLAVGSKNATTVGGLGQDWLYNTSAGGILWGDIANSVKLKKGASLQNWQRDDGTIVENATVTEDTRGYVTTAKVTDAQGNEQTINVVRLVANDASNADSFWFAKDVTLMDAQGADRLRYYGLPLLGGDTTMTTLSLAASAFISPYAGFALSAATGAFNLAQASQGRPLVYYDRFVPGVTYMLVDGAEPGTQDLLVGDVTDFFWAVLFGDRSAMPQSAQDLRGVMKVVDFDRGEGRFFASPGDLGIALDDFDPMTLLNLLDLYATGVPLLQSYVKQFALLATAMNAANDNEDECEVLLNKSATG